MPVSPSRLVNRDDGREHAAWPWTLAKGGVLYWIRSQPIGAAIGITVRRGAELRTARVVVGPSLASP